MAVEEQALMYAPELSREHEQEVLWSFHELMQSHEGGDAQIAVTKPDPDNRHEQRLDVVGVKNRRADIDTIAVLGKEAYEHFPDLVLQFREREDLLNNIVIDILAGNDIQEVYDHSVIHNIAVGSAALRCALVDFAATELHKDMNALQEDIIISKGVTLLDALGGIPAVEVLMSNWDTYFSTPPSMKVRASDIPRQTRLDFNTAMMQRYLESAEEGDTTIGRMHVAAGSGQSDTSVRSGLIGHRQTTVHMGPLAHGTIELLHRSRILPIGLTLDNKEPILTIGRLRNPIEQDEEAHGIMGGIALRNALFTGNNYVYHPTRQSLEAAIS